jgi:hypothetical protein
MNEKEDLSDEEYQMEADAIRSVFSNSIDPQHLIEFKDSLHNHPSVNMDPHNSHTLL